MCIPVDVSMRSKENIINIIELDSRDARYQSGIARYLDVLADNMPSNVHTLRIIFYRSPDTRELRIVPSESEISIYHPDGFPSPTLYDAVITLIGARLQNMPNLIVKSNCLGLERFAYMLRSRFYCKIIGVLHCLPSVAPTANGMAQSNPFFNMDHVILVCDCARAYLAAVKNNRPFSVVYNGIAPVKSVSKRMHDDVFRFIFANGLATHKGLARILPAIATVARQHKIEVVVLGGGSLSDELKSQVADLPIKFVGLVTDGDDIASYYDQADCALFASYSEACSYAGIEAMAYNLPIVSSDVAGLREMFAGAALYARAGDDKKLDVDEYAQHMIRIITSAGTRARLGAVGYGRYLQRYTARRMTRETLKIYKSLI